MSGKTSIELRKPDLSFPSGYAGPVSDIAAYTIARQLNQAGTWSARFPVLDPTSLRAATGWRATLRQEGNDPDLNPPDALLYRGKVVRHRYVIDASGGAQMELSGFTPLGIYGEKLTHLGQLFTDQVLGVIAEGIAPDASWLSFPIRTSFQETTITINDQTQLAALLKMNDLYRVALRERWDNLLQYVDQDALPRPEFLPTPVTELTFTNLENAGTELFGIMKSDGVGLISGVPLIAYEGTSVVNKIRAVGTDWDGAPLPLNPASSVFDSLYDVQTGMNPDGSNYYYVKDQDSIDEYGEIETQLVRSDVKNPSNNPTTKAAAELVLFAIVSTTLLQRRSEVLSFSTQIANGDECWALPGDRVRVRYRGVARTPDGVFTFADIDEQMLIVGRTDTGTQFGVRSVQFDLAAMMITRRLPNLPTAIAIPTPHPKDVKKQQPNIPEKDKPGSESFTPEAPSGSVPDDTMPLDDMTMPDLPDLPDRLQDILHGNGSYDPCCADQTTDINKTGDGAMPTKGTLPHWIATGFDSGNPLRNAGIARATGAVSGNADCIVSSIGSVTLPHDGNVDDTPPITHTYYSVVVIGPSPVVTGASVDWANASADLNVDILAFSMSIDSKDQAFPYSDYPADPFSWDIHTTMPLVDNRDVGFTDGGTSGFNHEPGETGSSYVGGVGPQGVSDGDIHNVWSKDLTIFTPRVCMWTWLALGRIRIQ